MKNTLLLIFTFLLLGFSETRAQSVDAFFNQADTFFSKNVANGKVAYKAIHSNPEVLNQLMESASKITLGGADAKTTQAFWINAYNLAVIKGVVDNYPIKSPLDKTGFFDKTKYNLGGTSITLNAIENKMLRAKYNDARFHFVLVCGAIGCPPIIPKAYKPSTLDSQLKTQATKALNNKNFIKVSDSKVELSEIFKWYQEDFVKQGSEIDYINTFRSDKISEDAKISYYPYDWRLNEQ